MTTADSPQDQPIVKLRTPADILEALPRMLRYQPNQQLVMLGLCGERKRFGAVQAVPIPAPEDFEVGATQFAGAIARTGPDSVILAIYADGRSIDPIDPEIEQFYISVAAALAEHQVGVFHALFVADGRWRSFDCSRACCQPAGTPVVPAGSPGGPSRVAAEMAMAGLFAATSRRDLEAQLAPLTGAATDAVARYVATAESQLVDHMSRAAAACRIEEFCALRRAAGRHLVEQALTAELPLPPQLVGELLVQISTDRTVRDYAAARAAVEVDRSRAVWTQVMREAPRGWVAAPATVLAYTYVVDGGGPMLTIAVCRALDDDPQYALAVLLDHLINNGVRPPVIKVGRILAAEAMQRRSDRQRARRMRAARGQRLQRGRRTTASPMPAADSSAAINQDC